jgi:hypothetical protein
MMIDNFIGMGVGGWWDYYSTRSPGSASDCWVCALAVEAVPLAFDSQLPNSWFFYVIDSNIYVVEAISAY